MSWFKVKDAARYAGVSPRTLRNWMKAGLKYSRLPSGMILIKESAIDEYLEKYEVNGNRVDQIVDEIMRDLRR